LERAQWIDCHLSVLTGDVNCEVAVIGAGITGALAGYHLAEAGVSTVVVGYGGNEITYSVIAAEIIRDEILGRPSY